MNLHNFSAIIMGIFMGAGFSLFIYSVFTRDPLTYMLPVMVLLVIGSQFSKIWSQTCKDRPKQHDWTDKEKEALK